MAVTGTQGVRVICTAALRLCGVTAVAEDPAAEDLAAAEGALQRLLKALQAQDALWVRTSMSLALASATASYALASPARPLRILKARFKGTSGSEIPMERLTRDEYDDLPLKTTQGIPTTFYFDRQREAATLYVWPVLATRTTETVELTYIREIEDVTTNGDLDVPAEWYEAITYGLADRLCDIYGVGDVRRARIAGQAADMLMTARAFGMDETLYLVDAD